MSALVEVAAAGAVAAVCFLIGSTNPAAIAARALGEDLRGSGSGNPGATNAGRVLGVRWGVLVGVLDVAKAYVPTLVLLHWPGLPADQRLRMALLGATAVVLGHMFSPFLRGRGGKGVATALGAILAIEPWIALAAFAVFVAVAVVLKRVGRGSVAACGALLLFGLLDGLGVLGLAPRLVGWWLAGLSLLVLLRHRRNIEAWVRRTMA
ncbi:MAG TPA: glycerol-3-phosphate acyltransferase [Dermatophilaceae bacterium]|nr:glycerol-3-phosphate acyltransferase [Dermatophilaceae bacterium]